MKDMIPAGETSCTEISVDDHEYIICLISETSPDQITVYMTDCEEVFKGCVPSEELKSLDNELKIFTQKSRSNLFKMAMREKKLTFSRNALQLRFVISSVGKSETLNVSMNEIHAENRTAHIKSLFFRIAHEISGHEEVISPEKPSISVPIRMNSQNRSVKRKLPGTSIVNPGQKRIPTGLGVQFEDD